jgi:hypothetical protein
MGLVFLFFINMLPSAFLFPRSGITYRGRATFVIIYNLPPGNRLEIIDDIAAILDGHSLSPTPWDTPVHTWIVNRVASPSPPPVEDKVSNPSPSASPDINTSDSFKYCPVINDVFPNNAPTPNLEINEIDKEKKNGIFYISPWLPSQKKEKSGKSTPIPSEDTILEAFKEMCRKYRM